MAQALSARAINQGKKRLSVIYSTDLENEVISLRLIGRTGNGQISILAGRTVACFFAIALFLARSETGKELFARWNTGSLPRSRSLSRHATLLPGGALRD